MLDNSDLIILITFRVLMVKENGVPCMAPLLTQMQSIQTACGLLRSREYTRCKTQADFVVKLNTNQIGILEYFTYSKTQNKVFAKVLLLTECDTPFPPALYIKRYKEGYVYELLY